MQKLIYLFLPLLIIGLSACNSEKKKTKEELQAEELDSLYDRVMAIHDEVMPSMNDLINQQGILRQDMQGMEEGPRKDSILTLLTELKKGEEGMRNWMRDIKSRVVEPEFYQKKHQKVMNYLKEEEQKIEEVAKQMKSSMKAADEFLTK